MRIPKYLSPTSISMFYSDIETFYSFYLSDNPPKRPPQTQPMSIGSAFDAYAKSYLYEALFGKGSNPKYELNAIFEEQVESHNRDWGLKEGKFVFDEYKKAGCFADLMIELSKAIGTPRFEFSVKDTINTNVGDITLLGKPDIFFTNQWAARIVLDWKVNGYCSPRTKSPMKGYIKLRPGDKIHKDCHLSMVNGVLINIGMYLEDGNTDWANQLSIYSWLLGEPIGSTKMVVGIDQICGPANSLRFATHRLKISKNWQLVLFENIKEMWRVIVSGHIFQDLTLEQSLERCELLDQPIEEDSLFSQVTSYDNKF